MAHGLSRSIDVYENTPVMAMERSGGVWEVRTARGSVHARKVILAVNGHLESFGFLRRRLMHVFLYASMTRPLTDDEDRLAGARDVWEAVPADPMGSTLRKIRTSKGTRLLVRNVFRFQSSLEASGASVAAAAPHHDRSFRARFPDLSAVDMQYRWGGRLCLSFNGVQVFGEIESDLYSACCQNGLGASKGTLIGMLAAEHASGHANPYIDEYLEQDRPTRIPPDPFSYVGANVFLRWKEWRAGLEK
jgi:glycine/D-amino acid oxidase-like deaminating enzyme